MKKTEEIFVVINNNRYLCSQRRKNMEANTKWLERLSIFTKAVGRLAEVIDISRQRKLNPFERDSLIKRFEFSYEMAWKLMMSYEKSNGIVEIHGSKDVVRRAYSMAIIENGEAWLEMIDARNSTSHLYDEEMAADVIDEIIHTYYPLFVELQNKMEVIANNE